MRRRGRKYSLRRRSRIKKYSRSFRRENTHRYVLRRTVLDGFFATSVGANFTPLLINPASFGNFAELQALYDSYKINYVRVTIRPKFPSQLSTTASTDPNFNCYLFSVLDFDSPFSTTLSRSEMQQYRNCRTSRITSTHTRYFKPCAVQQVATLNNGGTQTLNNVKRSGWFDIATPLDTFNMRVWVDQLTANPTGDPELSFDIDYEVNISCKNVR